MGARPSQFRKGGGFLNNVDGVITGYEFSDETPAKDGGREPFKPGKDPKTGKARFHSLYCYLSARADGADEDVSTALFVGGADDWDVSDDGHELIPTKDGQQLGASSSFAKFLGSLCESGFPETRLPEETFDFSPIIGTRVRFIQRVDEDGTKRLGKRKGKDGKEYNRTDLVVDQVYDLPEGDDAPVAAPAKGGKSTSVSGKGKAPKGEDLNALAQETLAAILADAPGNTINKKNLATKVIMKLTKHPKREDVRGIITSDEFLNNAEGVDYNAKTGAVTLVSDESEE
jgi:hypothetical protein